jgi:hypothetical protein
MTEDKWTTTKGLGMSAGEFGKSIREASCTNYEASQILLKDAGQLEIDEMHIPSGFSGGGAYTPLPAKADPLPVPTLQVPCLCPRTTRSVVRRTLDCNVGPSAGDFLDNLMHAPGRGMKSSQVT